MCLEVILHLELVAYVVIQARLRLYANRKESEKAIKLIDKYV